MQLRIKKTPYWGEVIGNSGTLERPRALLKMKNGDIVDIPFIEVTDKTIFESFINRLTLIHLSIIEIRNNLKRMWNDFLTSTK